MSDNTPIYFDILLRFDTGLVLPTPALSFGPTIAVVIYCPLSICHWWCGFWMFVLFVPLHLPYDLTVPQITIRNYLSVSTCSGDSLLDYRWCWAGVCCSWAPHPQRHCWTFWWLYHPSNLQPAPCWHHLCRSHMLRNTIDFRWMLSLKARLWHQCAPFKFLSATTMDQTKHVRIVIVWNDVSILR
jgi:hypothetical protein